MDTRARLLAAGWFVGAVALALTGCDSGPSPTSESSLSTPGAATGGVTSRPTGDPRQIDGRLDRVVFLDKDVAYASWVLTPPAPGVGGPLAWATTRTRDGWGHSRRLGRADLLGRATPLLSSDGSVASWSDHPFHLTMVDPPGRRQVVRVARFVRPAPRSAILVGSGWQISGLPSGLWWWRPGSRMAYAVPASPHLGLNRTVAVVAASGRIWVQGWGPGQSVWLAWTDDGGAHWREHRVARRGYPGGILVSADVVGVLAWRSHGDVPVAADLVSVDGGATWQPWQAHGLPARTWSEGDVGGPAGAYATPEGRAMVVDVTSQRLLVAEPGSWDRFDPAPGVGRVSWVMGNGDLVWAGGAEAEDPAGPHLIHVSDDGGLSWDAVRVG